MKHKRFPVKLEILLGVFLLTTCWLVHNHIELKVAQARVTCSGGTCTMTLPESKLLLKNQACDLKKLSDATFQVCLNSNQKHTCYQSVKEIDSQVVELETKYFQKWGEYPVCN